MNDIQRISLRYVRKGVPGRLMGYRVRKDVSSGIGGLEFMGLCFLFRSYSYRRVGRTRRGLGTVLTSVTVGGWRSSDSKPVSSPTVAAPRFISQMPG